MAGDVPKLDANRSFFIMGVTDDVAQDEVNARFNPSTKRLEVDAAITAGGGGTDPVGLKNIAGSAINPAKEDGNLQTLAGKDFATAAKQLPDNHNVTVSNQITGYATSAKQLPDNHQVSVSNIASVPLITGFATSAKQLADGHNVNVNNASGASAVNIQDGGNTITIDGTVTANISGSIGNTSFASTIADGADVTLGAKADAKSAATDTTAVTIMQVLKEISYMEQNPASRAVTGTFWQTTQPVSIASMPSTPVTGTFWQTTQPVSATDLDIRDLTHASDSVKIGDGTDLADVLDLTNANPLAVAILDGDGTQITSFGGGTQYTEGDTDASITGTVAMMEVAGDVVQPIQGTVAGGLLVNLGTNNDVTVTGTVDLGATDNAVLDTIDATLDAINAKLVTGTDIGDVTINNSTGAAAVNIQDGGNTITVDGTVTANLSATDNSVLDSIDTSTASHYITGVGHGVKTVTTAGTDLALAASTPCKRVDIQAQTDNTSVIAVGATGVDATVATGTGIILYPGDVYSLEIDNLADIFIDSLVNGEGVRYSYYT